MQSVDVEREQLVLFAPTLEDRIPQDHIDPEKNLEELPQRGVELFSPLAGQHAVPDNPAVRDDPTVPVPEADSDRLPRNPQSKQLDKAAFVYVEEEDRKPCGTCRRR